MSNIYQELWILDQEKNGQKVTGKRNDGNWEDKNAVVKVNEQVRTSGRRAIDLARDPLFEEIENFDQMLLDYPTYGAFYKLLDNYFVHYRTEEISEKVENDEIDDFLKLVVETEVMKKAQAYIVGDLKEKQYENDAAFKKLLKKIWFEYYSNYYMGKPTHYCSGFEHVFVGEGKYNLKQSQRVLGEISGYHNWIKYYIDEHVRGVANFLGHNYGKRYGSGARVPMIVTLQMLWNHIDVDGNVKVELFKKRGGFFVGTSPECEFAIGTVAYFEHKHRKFGDKGCEVKINDMKLKLVLYRETLIDGRRGDRIRSFYPVYIGEDAEPDYDVSEIIQKVFPVEAEENNGDIRIVEALVDPKGVLDVGNETVTLKNVIKNSINIKDWTLEDRQKRVKCLQGVINENSTLEVKLDGKEHYDMRLGNKNGAIMLKNPEGEVVSVVNYKKKNIDKKGKLLF